MTIGLKPWMLLYKLKARTMYSPITPLIFLFIHSLPHNISLMKFVTTNCMQLLYKQNIIPNKAMFLQIFPRLTAPCSVQWLKTRPRSGLVNVAVSNDSLKQKTNYNNTTTLWMTGDSNTCYDTMSVIFVTLGTCGPKKGKKINHIKPVF